ncbi:uncharacterized protein LAESUDRAFT_315533 [Laetiporus sulphureus 93-53]|uniref:Uncharacterized protein n=1 Tax=Laetiporus sulphureus 93-53 TaxID=1314785 RepID=A0A165D2E5_9APHY|nr:uncharacterized protein LAESUDRAFT_315533 [Laetiporus sulphureus 93-53]KZT04018.1 hypothetical protein LAESUDRAFT_315533 [Laetiporus sulphureus 93-53]
MFGSRSCRSECGRTAATLILMSYLDRRWPRVISLVGAPACPLSFCRRGMFAIAAGSRSRLHGVFLSPSLLGTTSFSDSEAISALTRVKMKCYEPALPLGGSLGLPLYRPL